MKRRVFKGEQGVILIYFRRIPLHQQKFLVISVLSNSPWLPRYLKNVQNETTKHISVGNILGYNCFYNNLASQVKVEFSAKLVMVLWDTVNALFAIYYY